MKKENKNKYICCGSNKYIYSPKTYMEIITPDVMVGGVIFGM